MFIQTENTPNPATVKFIPGQAVAPKDSVNFSNKEQAVLSPLALELFKINGVKAVYFGADFISVTKSESKNWDNLKTEILTTIMDHYISGKPIILENNDIKQHVTTESDNEIVKQIKEIIETRVRPAVAQDGGDIIFHGFEDGVVKLEMHGACSGCPSSSVTLKNGIENMLKHYIPEVESVEAIEN